MRGSISVRAGFNVFNWNPDGPAIAALLFVSSDLPRHWPVLDEFEGDGYLRIVISADTSAGPVVANVYVDARNCRTGSEISS